MAAVSVLYRPEKTNHPVPPTEPWKTTRKTTAQTIFTLDSNFQTTLQDLTDFARDLPTEEALSREIEKLCDATLAIDEAFYDIGRRLTDAVKEQSKHKALYDICYALETQWNGHHLNLLWRSRVFAGEAQSAVDDFRELVLPSLRDVDMTRLEKQEIIREQIRVLQMTSQPSQTLCQEFLDFGRTLDKYIADFSQVVGSFEISEQSKQVAELEDRLYNAKIAMEAISQEVKELGWKFAMDVTVAGISFVLAVVVPTLWAKVVDVTTISVDCINAKNSGFKYLEARRRSDLAVAEYVTIRDEYELEKSALGQMVKLETTLNVSKPLVQDVTTKLGMFASVWAAITADIRKLENSLCRTEDPTSKLFIRRVQRLEKMYGYLSQALRHYQVTVRLT